MSVNRPTAATELGAALAKYRTAANLSLRALGDRVGMSNAKISLWENGHRLPSLEDLGKVLDEFGVVGDERERLLAMRREAEGPGVLLSSRAIVGGQLKNLIEQEQVARRITDVAPLLVPGLLQTADYARAILSEDSDTDTRVTLRMGRREILRRTRDPVELHALIDDEVFSRGFVTPAVMAEQLNHLLTMAKLPNVTIQLVPSTHGAYTPLLAGPFILLEFDTAPPSVHLEHYRSSVSLWEEEDVQGFKSAVERITEAAMTPARTVEVIEGLLNGLEQS